MELPPLNVRLDGRRGTLLDDFTVAINRRVDGFNIGTITVPKGFVTDFASVPWFFWRVCPPVGEYNEAAVVHDYLYSEVRFSRRADDWVFRHIMRWCGVSWWKRQAMHRAVRLGGWRPWRKYWGEKFDR